MLARTPIARQFDRPYLSAPFSKAIEPIAVAVIGQRWIGNLSLPTTSFGLSTSAELTKKSGMRASLFNSSSISSAMSSSISLQAACAAVTVSVLSYRLLFLASMISRMILFDSSRHWT